VEHDSARHRHAMETEWSMGVRSERQRNDRRSFMFHYPFCGYISPGRLLRIVHTLYMKCLGMLCHRESVVNRYFLFRLVSVLSRPKFFSLVLSRTAFATSL